MKKLILLMMTTIAITSILTKHALAEKVPIDMTCSSTNDMVELVEGTMNLHLLGTADGRVEINDKFYDGVLSFHHNSEGVILVLFHGEDISCHIAHGTNFNINASI